MPVKSTAERFFAFVSKDPDTGCWNWTGFRCPKGYGRFKMNGNGWQAHRAAFVLFVRPLEAEEIVHHKCENTSCVNPDHLQATTQAEHNRDLTPNNFAYKRAHQTHCKFGHELADDNLVPHVLKHYGLRRCLICERRLRREAMRRRRERDADYRLQRMAYMREYHARKKAEKHLTSSAASGAAAVPLTEDPPQEWG